MRLFDSISYTVRLILSGGANGLPWWRFLLVNLFRIIRNADTTKKLLEELDTYLATGSPINVDLDELLQGFYREWLQGTVLATEEDFDVAAFAAKSLFSWQKYQKFQSGMPTTCSSNP